MKVVIDTNVILDVWLESSIKDFEDAVIEAVAFSEKADYRATRNVSDFKGGRIPALEPIG